MSYGGPSATTAAARPAGPTTASSSRARSSSGASGRLTGRPAQATRAGLAPRKTGAGETSSPTTAMLTDRWWPSNRQDHGASPAGSPNTVTQ